MNMSNKLGGYGPPSELINRSKIQGKNKDMKVPLVILSSAEEEKIQQRRQKELNKITALTHR